MKTILCTLIIFSITTIYSQSFEDLKKADTIYIKFKGKTNEKKATIQTRQSSRDFGERLYSFDLISAKLRFNFEHWQFKNWDKKNANITSEKRKVNKSFLRKHRNKILDVNILKDYKYDDIVCNLFSPLKVLYVIDFTEKEKKNIILYEVISTNTCPVSE